MAKKTTKPKKSSGTKPGILPRKDQLDPRKKLLARVAGDVAAAIVQAPSETTTSPEAIAEVAVDIAEQILLKAGLEAPTPPATDPVA